MKKSSLTILLTIAMSLQIFTEVVAAASTSDQDSLQISGQISSDLKIDAVRIDYVSKKKVGGRGCGSDMLPDICFNYISTSVPLNFKMDDSGAYSIQNESLQDIVKDGVVYAPAQIVIAVVQGNSIAFGVFAEINSDSNIVNSDFNIKLQRDGVYLRRSDAKPAAGTVPWMTVVKLNKGNAVLNILSVN